MTDFAKEARDLAGRLIVVDADVRAALARMIEQLTRKAHAEAAEIALPDIETVSAKVHEAWIAAKLAAGVTSRRSESGEELMRPYEKLSEPAKDLDRNTVRAVYAAILAASPPPLKEP